NGYAAGSRYDLVTGFGTPYADQVVGALVAWTGSGTTGTFTAPGGSSGKVRPCRTSPSRGRSSLSPRATPRTAPSLWGPSTPPRRPQSARLWSLFSRPAPNRPSPFRTPRPSR